MGWGTLCWLVHKVYLFIIIYNNIIIPLQFWISKKCVCSFWEKSTWKWNVSSHFGIIPAFLLEFSISIWRICHRNELYSHIRWKAQLILCPLLFSFSPFFIRQRKITYLLIVIISKLHLKGVEACNSSTAYVDTCVSCSSSVTQLHTCICTHCTVHFSVTRQ